jgi:hypothetical protein
MKLISKNYKHRSTKQQRYNEKNEILCTYCTTYKEKEEFLESNLEKHFYKCKLCETKYRKERIGDINRIIDNIYGHQRSNCEVLYSWEQFSQWLIKKTNFLNLYLFWKSVNYDKNFVPAVLRINSSKPYSLDNLKVTTAKFARTLCSKKREKKVIQLDKQGKKIATFCNAKVASEFINYKFFSNIHLVCKGQKKSAGGFMWKYE